MSRDSAVEGTLSTLFDRLAQYNVDFCVLRNYESLPEKVGNDVDLWVRSDQFDEFGTVLLDVIRDSEWKVFNYRNRLNGNGGGEYLLITSEGKTEILHLDVWTKLYWRGIPFVKEDCIAERIDSNRYSFPIPQAGVEAATLLLKDLLYNKEIPSRYRSRIYEFSREDPDGFQEATASSLRPSTVQMLESCISERDWEQIEKSAEKIRKSLIYRAIFTDTFQQMRYWYQYGVEKLKDFFSPSTGLFVVFIGPDGSGKTTTTQAVSNHPFTNLFTGVSYFHGRFGILPELKTLKRWMTGSNGKKQKKEAGSKNADKGQYNPVRASVYPLYYTLDFLLGTVLIHKGKARRKMIIFDRYYFDYYYQPEFKKCPRWLLDFLKLFTPSPDAIIYLENDPETIHKRKPELQANEIDRQAQICKMIVEKSGKSIEIRTDDSLEEIADQIVEELIEKCRT